MGENILPITGGVKMNENSITKNIPYLTHYDTMQDYIKAENKV